MLSEPLRRSHWDGSAILQRSRLVGLRFARPSGLRCLTGDVQLGPTYPISKFQHWLQSLSVDPATTAHTNPNSAFPTPTLIAIQASQWDVAKSFSNPVPASTYSMVLWASSFHATKFLSKHFLPTSKRNSSGVLSGENYSTKFRENGTQKQTWKLDHLIVPTKLRYTGHG